MCFCYFDPFGAHRAPMQNPSVFHGLATWSDQKMVTLGAFFRVRFWVPFLHAFGGAFGVPLGIIWETFWGPWDPLGQPWRPLGLSWGPLGTPLVSLRIPFGTFGSSLAPLWTLGGPMGIYKKPFEIIF